MLSDEFLYEYNNNNKSGKMSSEKYVSKNFENDYNYILKYCSGNLNGLPFKQKVYHTVNQISNLVICNNPKCENVVKFKNSTLGYRKHCSKKCIGLDPEIKKKKEQSNLKKFGVKHASLNKDIKKKVKKIYENRTQKDKESILCKRVNTVKEKYGVENVAHLKEVKEKRIDSFKENINQWKESYKKTSLERYGVDHPWMKSEIHEKTRNGFYESYKQRISKRLKSYKDEFIGFENGGRVKLKCGECGDEYLIKGYNFYFRSNNNYKICTNCNPVGSNYNVSNMELQLLNFIESNYEYDVVTNTRNIIPPYEIDIYLPELKLAFEFNGLYWHSELNKDKRYHYDKTKKCEEIGVHLIHIWEDDWLINNDIVKSMILNKLNKSNKLYARKCIIKNVDNKVYRDFLNNNHIQGYTPSGIKLGLYYNGDLVSLMTFGKLRHLMGSKPKDGSYELVRFCNKINTSVVGGASKLFKHFIKKYNPKFILSYSDNSYSKGSLYNKLGFEFKGDSKFNYYWVINNERNHRYNFRKSKLIEMGYSKDKSEREIMYEDVGSYRVWGCGNKRWEYSTP